MTRDAIGLAALAASVQINPAIGAMFGCLLFISMNSFPTAGKQAAMVASSYGIGYGAGVAMDGSPHAMWVAAVVSALVVTAIISMRDIMESGKEIPPWMNFFTDTIEKLIKAWRK